MIKYSKTCDFKLHTDASKQFHKKTIFAKKEKRYAVITDDLFISDLEWDLVLSELKVK